TRGIAVGGGRRRVGFSSGRDVRRGVGRPCILRRPVAPAGQATRADARGDASEEDEAEESPHVFEDTFAARSRSTLRSRSFFVIDAARSNSAFASSNRESCSRRSPRTVGSRW